MHEGKLVMIILLVCECRWLAYISMHEARGYCGIATVGSYLYAVGGFNGTSWLRSMEKYCPLTNQWTLLTPM